MRSLRTGLSLLLAAGLGAQAPLSGTYKASADKLVAEARAEASKHAYDTLQDLCDSVGHRISGSPELDKAVVWAQAQMKAAGLSNVHTEAAMVPHWVRGAESCELLAPRRIKLALLGLGMSVGTPEGGITADVVVVSSFDELAKLPDDAIKGKIVLFDEPYQGYGKTVAYRTAGPSIAAKRGAVACLIRSVASASLDSPHTGVTNYEKGVAKIPAAALSVEHASLLHRLSLEGKPVRLHLEMGAKTLPDVPSANVIGEIPGSEKPNEVVILSGHLDSWDVGQGAQDDGIGAVLSLEAARNMLKAGLHPRRTVRVILWTCEEFGGIGAEPYAKAHAADSKDIVAAFESDSGNGRIQGFSVDLFGENRSRAQAHEATEAESKALALMNEAAPLLEPLGAGKMSAGGSGEDVGFLVENGAVGIGVGHDASRYFDVHHSEADTFDHINFEDLAHNVEAYSVFAYVLADMPQRLK